MWIATNFSYSLIFYRTLRKEVKIYLCFNNQIHVYSLILFSKLFQKYQALMSRIVMHDPNSPLLGKTWKRSVMREPNFCSMPISRRSGWTDSRLCSTLVTQNSRIALSSVSSVKTGKDRKHFSARQEPVNHFITRVLSRIWKYLLCTLVCMLCFEHAHTYESIDLTMSFWKMLIVYRLPWTALST